MEIDTYYPTHPVLRKHIEYYYFQKTDSCDFATDYYAFPNTLQALNIHKNVSCEINAHQVKVSGTEEDNYKIILQGRFELPLHVMLRGRINKLTILFKPLGLNHFIRSPYTAIASYPTQIFNDWDEDNNYTAFLDLFYEEKANSKRIQVLEDFLMLRYRAFNEAAMLQQVLNMLSDFSFELSIEEIALKMNLNTRTFNRLFRKHLGISPVGFKKIARFRHSLKNKIFDTHFTSLTKIGYESNFYDQAYFTKVYKKITGENPSSFFNSIDKLADNQLIFKFVNK